MQARDCGGSTSPTPNCAWDVGCELHTGLGMSPIWVGGHTLHCGGILATCRGFKADMSTGLWREHDFHSKTPQNCARHWGGSAMYQVGQCQPRIPGGGPQRAVERLRLQSKMRTVPQQVSCTDKNPLRPYAEPDTAWCYHSFWHDQQIKKLKGSISQICHMSLSGFREALYGFFRRSNNGKQGPKPELRSYRSRYLKLKTVAPPISQFLRLRAK